MEPKKSKRNLHNSSTTNTLNMVDMISTLPDCILGLILSHLSTKNAVATSILSKRWKFVWTTINSLDFCLDDLRNRLAEDEDMKFARFVNRVLLLLDGELLNKFRLIWKPSFIPSQVSSWITTAISRNVHHLFVCVMTHVFFNDVILDLYEPVDKHKLVVMPASVFSADSLQCLELNGSIIVPAEIVVGLPRLESLKLDSVYFQSEESFEKLIRGCPILNYLHIHVDDDYIKRYSKDWDDFTYKISSTSPKYLELHVIFSDSHSNRSLELEASSLEYLNLVGPISKVSVEGCLSSLVEADFKIHVCGHEHNQDNYDRHVEAVRTFDCAKTITLSPDATWALSDGTIGLSTKFTRLTKLEFGAVFCHSSSLRKFIQNSDNLEVLIICQERACLCEADYDHLIWTDPVEVPRCLSNSLKEVLFKGYDGFDEELEMIGYMLKHGSVLEVMHVTCKPFEDEYSLERLELLQEISRFPRKSPTCIIEFIE